MSTHTSVGVLLPTREMAITNTYAMAPLIDFARQAEELGFGSVWTGDSVLARPRFDPFVVLSAVAVATSRVTLGTAALTAALRPPLLGANLVASLDHATGSRLVLGVGSGFPVPETAAEFDAVGVPYARRTARLDEIAQLWRRAWHSRESGVTDFRGQLCRAERLDRLPPPATPGGPPLWLAASDTPRVLARVVEFYDGWMPFVPTARAYETAWQRIGELAEARGRPIGEITPSLYATVNVNRDRAQARAQLDEYVRGYYGHPLEVMETIQCYGYGTAEACAEWLAGYLRAGARHVVLRIGSLDPDPQLKEIAEVLPRV